MLVADDGRLLASATSEHQDFASPRTGWAEQDPADWWRATEETIAALGAAA